MISIHRLVTEIDRTSDLITDMITRLENAPGLSKEGSMKILLCALDKVEKTIELVQTSLNPKDSKNFSFRASSKELLFSIEQLGEAWMKLNS